MLISCVTEENSTPHLDNRDIYVFKFGENDFRKVLTELLAVTACIARDSEEEIAEMAMTGTRPSECALKVVYPCNSIRKMISRSSVRTALGCTPVTGRSANAYWITKSFWEYK